MSFFQDLGVENVALKRGALGVLAAAQGERRTLPAVAPRGVVDTTGAGDAFVGGPVAPDGAGRGPLRGREVGRGRGGPQGRRTRRHTQPAL